MISWMFWLSPIFLILLLTYLKLDFKSHYLMWIFSIAYLLLFFTLPAVEYGSNDFRGVSYSPSTSEATFSEETVYKTYFFQIIFFILLIIGYSLVSERKKLLKELSSTDYLNIKSLVFFSTTLSIVANVGVVLSSGMSLTELLNSGRFAYWETRSVPLTLLFTYLQTTLAISMFLIPYIKKEKLLVIYSAIAFFILFYVEMVIFGSRMNVIFSASSFIVGLLNYFRINNLKIKYFRVTILGVLFLHFMIIWQYVRYTSHNLKTLGDWLAILFNVKEAYNTSSDLTYFFDAAVASFYYVPQFHDFLHGDTYVRLLMFFVPSTIFPLKPEETQRVFAGIVNPQAYSIGATYPPSLVGDSYINFGFLGVFLAIFLGVFLKYSQNILNGNLSITKIALGATLVGFTVLLLRGTFNGAYNIIFIWFLVGTYFVIFAKKRAKNN